MSIAPGYPTVSPTKMKDNPSELISTRAGFRLVL